MVFVFGGGQECAVFMYVVMGYIWCWAFPGEIYAVLGWGVVMEIGDGRRGDVVYMDRPGDGG